MRRCLVVALAAGMLVSPTVGSLCVSGKPVLAAAKKSSRISEKRAKTIALNDANVKPKQVASMAVDSDAWDKTKNYDVSFYVKIGKTKYRHYYYVIDPKTGAIKKRSNAERKLLTKREALREALDDADLSRGKIDDEEITLDTEDGRMVYDIEFTREKKDNEYTYNYTVDAFNGEIIDSDDDDDGDDD